MVKILFIYLAVSLRALAATPNDLQSCVMATQLKSVKTHKLAVLYGGTVIPAVGGAVGGALKLLPGDWIGLGGSTAFGAGLLALKFSNDSIFYARLSRALQDLDSNSPGLATRVLAMDLNAEIFSWFGTSSYGGGPFSLRQTLLWRNVNYQLISDSELFKALGKVSEAAGICKRNKRIIGYNRFVDVITAAIYKDRPENPVH